MHLRVHVTSYSLPTYHVTTLSPLVPPVHLHAIIILILPTSHPSAPEDQDLLRLADVSVARNTYIDITYRSLVPTYLPTYMTVNYLFYLYFYFFMSKADRVLCLVIDQIERMDASRPPPPSPLLWI